VNASWLKVGLKTGGKAYWQPWSEMPTDAEIQEALQTAAQSDTGRINVPEPAYRSPESVQQLGLEQKAAEQPPAYSDDQIKQALQSAYATEQGPTLEELQTIAAKRIVSNVAGIAAAPAQAVAALIASQQTEAPNLQGLSVDQVKATRDQMVQDRANLDKQKDDLINSGETDERQLYLYSQRTSNLEQRIKEADGIIASGKSQTEPSPMGEPVGRALRDFGREAQPATQRLLDQVFPTNQDFVNSFPGQIVTYGADAITLGGASVLGGPLVGTAAASSLFANQTYQDAKEHGASDEDAERASVLTGLTTAATMPVMGAGVDYLANSMAGLTPKEGIAAIIRAGVHTGTGGGEFAAFQLQQNAIAKLTGYDPNRPLDKDTWQAFWTGIGFGAVTSLISESPRLARLNKPDVTVRNKDGAPPETGPASQEAAPTVAAAPTAPEAAPVAPAEPLERAQAAVPPPAATPEQVIAQQGAPEDELAKFNQTVQSIVQGAAPAPEAAPVTEAPAREARPAEAPTTTEARPAEAVAPTEAAPEIRSAVGQAISNALARGEIDQGQHDRFQEIAATDPGMAVEMLGNVTGRATRAAIAEAEAGGAEFVSAEKGPPAWYEGEEAAARVPLAAPEPEDRPVTLADVKREVNDAQAQMGMEDHLHYVPNVEALPDHVKEGLTVGERSNTAQVVRDNKLGDTYVIGDRFGSLTDLRRKIIEETLPYAYHNVTDLGTEHNAFSSDLGRYDPISDRPTLNTHAILRSDNPYSEASKTAMEEVNVHQGISRLLGPRNGQRYVDAMNSVQANFDRLGLNDILAQKKGYANAEEMANAYGAPDWRTNPRSAHKMTEELAGAYSRTFKNPGELAANGPSWWQNALRNITGGIRQFLGLKVAPYDVQSLLADSAAALRRPKYSEPTQFHVATGEKAKADMTAFQFANRLAEPTERAPVGEAFVRARAAELQAGLRPGEFVREQPLRLAMQQTRDFQERMNLLNRETAIATREGHLEVMQAARDMFQQDFGADPNRAMDDLMAYRRTGAINPALTEVVNRATTDQIRALRAAGANDEANLMAARLDRMNMLTAADVTEEARGLSAQRLRHMDGANEVARLKNGVQDTQQTEFAKERNRGPADAANKGLEEVKQATKQAADSLRSKTEPGLKAVAGATYRFSTTRSLPEQYVSDLVSKIDDALHKTSSGPVERPPVQEVYDTFRKNIQQIIRERVPLEPSEKAAPPSPTATLREVMTNYPAYREAWVRTMDMLYNKDPNLYQAFNRALEEPVGEGLANRLAAEHGQNLSDLIYNHFSSVDRISEDLARKVSDATGLGVDQTNLLANRLQSLFKDIVTKEQSAKLEQILKSVGGTKTPPKGELDRLVDHIVLGGLDNPEWLNHVAPRFGIDSYTPKQLDKLRAAGDKMAEFRDDGLANSVIAQKVRQDIGDLTKLNSGPQDNPRWKYINDVYAASLLTGPLTHMPYWQQGLLTGSWDTLVQGIRSVAKTQDPAVLMQMLGKAVSGYSRGMSEFGPILREGIKPPEEFMPEEGGKPLYRGELEKAQFAWNKPGSWYSKYKYVRNFLDAVSNLMVRGPQYAVHHANMMSLVWDAGLRGQDAYQAATDVVLGTEDQRTVARDEANDFAEKYRLNNDQKTMLYGELLDKYKTGDQPDSSLANSESQRLRDVATRAFDTGLRGTLRGDVPGISGYVSRGLLSFMNRFNTLRPIAEFAKVPFNAINEFMAWTPVGIYRGLPDLVKGDTRGIESYLSGIPGMEKAIETSKVSEEQLRDIAWNQMSKGLVGSTVGSLLTAYVRSQLSNPNAPIRFTYQGPSQYGQQEIEQGKGWQPRSIYIGGAWHSYENTPWRALFSTLGAYEDYFRYEKQNPDALSNEVQAAEHALAGGLTSAFGSPLQGITAALNFLTQFSGGAGGGAERAVGNFLTQTISAGLTGLVGGTAVRQLYRLYDPAEYEGNAMWQKAARYTPVVNSMFLQPKLNVFGEKMTASPLKGFPEYGSTVNKDDPVWNYLAEHPQIQLTMPGNSASAGGVKMTPDEIYQYHLARGPYLKEQLGRAFENPTFNDLSPERQNYLVKHTYEREANRIGQAAVLRYRQEHPVSQERLSATQAVRGLPPEPSETEQP
jgi:hypothetical protein